MILSTPCAKKRKCRICTNKRTAALTNKPRFVEPGFAVWANRKYCLSAFAVRRNQEYVLSGFAVWLKQKHCLPAFAVRRNREHCLAGLVMTEPSSFAVQNLFRHFFPFSFPFPRARTFSPHRKKLQAGLTLLQQRENVHFDAAIPSFSESGDVGTFSIR